ncbi:unnamed protein product [Rhizophagus irregularis]|uniref:Uncharacterized protein n=1 Tax=Rhizophagus irregularis TaxID=588596 RepID=A0A915Z9H7_9GLOM|nr:unnamed protein product [Rhizophagus irregularis]CAB5366046.1 unnamed protein product [Rhizophagus irregularis]
MCKNTGLLNSPEFLCYPEENRLVLIYIYIYSKLNMMMNVYNRSRKLNQYLKGNMSRDGMIVHNSCFRIWYSHMFRL